MQIRFLILKLLSLLSISSIFLRCHKLQVFFNFSCTLPTICESIRGFVHLSVRPSVHPSVIIESISVETRTLSACMSVEGGGVVRPCQSVRDDTVISRNSLFSIVIQPSQNPPNTLKQGRATPESTPLLIRV